MTDPQASMRLAIITESYAPLNTSAAVQLAALADALREQGHTPVVIVPMTPDDAAQDAVIHDHVDGIDVIRLRVPVKKTEGYAGRLLYEAVMPFAMRHHWKKIAATQQIDGVIWYSHPSFTASLRGS